jgi:hypothetical protein
MERLRELGLDPPDESAAFPVVLLDELAAIWAPKGGTTCWPITFLEERHGSRLKTVILYGSHACGTATEDSDVDLLVVDDTLRPDEVRRSLSDLLLDILLEEGELVSVVVLPESFYKSYNSPFLLNVRGEGVPV